MLHPTNRGVALYGDKVFFAASEAVLVALDAGPARRCGPTTVADNKQRLLHDAGAARRRRQGDGRRLGRRVRHPRLRRRLRRRDRQAELWKTYTVPAPGEPGSETWPKGDQWKTGGAPVWVTGNYDPETNLAFWGTGNGGPWMGDQRPGDNLYTTSTVAIDVATGQHQGPLPVPPERLVGLGRSVAADPRRLPAQRPHGEGPDQRRAQRLPVVPRAQRRPDQLRRGHAVRAAERVPQPRSEDRPARRRSRAQARHRQDRRLLPVALGRQELAADRLQPEDADDLHPGQREPVRHARSARAVDVRRRAAASPARPATLYAGARAPITSAKCRPGTSTPASGSGRTRSRRRRTGARCSPPAAASCSAAAPTIASSTPSTPRRGKLLWEFPTNSGITRPAVVVHGRRQAVHRRAVRLGHRLARRCRRG